MALPPLFINEERWPQDEYQEAGLKTAARVVCHFVLFFYKFIYLFMFGCVGSSSLCEGFL